jgi:hypothetical protein
MLLFSWVIILGALTVAFSAISICLITTLNIANLIPSMPYAGALLLGISFLALAFLSAIGTLYCFLYFRKLIKIYFRWNVNKISYNKKYPPVIIYTILNKKLKRIVRKITGIFTVIFAVSFLSSCIVLTIYTDFKPFWHALNWFVN